MPSQPICCAQHLPMEKKRKIQEAFLKINDPGLLGPLQFKQYGAVEEGVTPNLNLILKVAKVCFCIRRLANLIKNGIE